MPKNSLERRSTGVIGLDDILDGGIPNHSVVAIEGEPGSAKTTFCRQFVYSGLIKKEPCIYVVTGQPVEYAKQEMAALGLDVSPFSKDIIFVDCYSWRTPGSKPSSYALSSLRSLNELTRLISQAMSQLNMRERKGRIIIDSISDLLLHVEPNSVFKFLQLVAAQVKEAEAIALIVIESGLHEDKTISTINYITDGTIEFKLQNAKRLLRVGRMAGTLHPLNWIVFHMSEKGVELKAEGFFS